jgi:putative MATE family efflux protein
MLSVVQSAIPFIDGLFVNNAAGTLVASAVIFCTPVVNAMAAIGQGLSAAAMAIIGQANGAGDLARARKASVLVIVLGAVLGVISAPLLVVAGIAISRAVHGEISHNVFLYLSLYSFVLPFSFLESVYNGLKSANGKPEDSFVRMVIMLALKTAFNSLFVAWLGMGIVGCVLSSLIANAIIAVWMYCDLFLRRDADRLSLAGFTLDRGLAGEIWKVGYPAAVASIVLNLGFFLINRETESYGPIVLNGQGIASNITAICFNLPSAFGPAVTTMVSMLIGAGQPSRAKWACKVGCALSALSAAAVIAIVVPLSPFFTVLFTREKDVLEIANRALHIYTYSVIGFGVCMTAQGAFVGLGNTRVPLALGILRIWFLRYVFILATERYLSFYSVFWGNLFSNYVAAAIAVIAISRDSWVSRLTGSKADLGGSGD